MTRFKDTIQIGTNAALTMATGVMLLMAGGITMQGERPTINVQGGPIVLSVTGSELLNITRVPCTSTGGGPTATGPSEYDTCIVRNPYSARSNSGLVLGMALSFESVPNAMTVDVGYTTGLKTGTGTEWFDNFRVGTGTYVLTMTGSAAARIWNNGTYLKVGTSTAIAEGAAFSGALTIYSTELPR